MVLVKDYGVQDGATRGVLYLLREGTAESFGVLDGSTEMRSSRLDVSRILGSSPMRSSQTSAEFRVMVRRARCRGVDTLSARSFCDRSQFPICVKNWACSRRCSTAGKKSFSRTERLPSKRRNVLAARRRRNTWKTSTSYGSNELLQLSKAADLAHTEIVKLQAQARAR
jgi:hypothetical protein